MKTEHWLYTAALLALVGVIVFAKGKVCVNNQNGDARGVASWLFPCSSTETAVNY